MKRLVLLLACACSQPSAAKPAAPVSAAACNTAEHRQLDFWIGDWDVKIRARNAPDKDAWGESTGTQHVESILGGCAINENFSAGGPQPWAGKSYSVWVPKLGKWRQTWVDDSGNYLAFTGGIEAGTMTLYGEPREADGKTIHMRMVFQDVTPRSLHWEWQRTEDHWATHKLMMAIDYVRR
jgi:hypothetical protein